MRFITKLSNQLLSVKLKEPKTNKQTDNKKIVEIFSYMMNA